MTDSPGHPDAERARFEDLKESYALGALPEPERRWFESYLAAHPALAHDVDDLLAAANLLALLPGDQEPPPSLRRNLLERIEAESRNGAPLPRGRRFRSDLSQWARPLAAAAALLVVVGGLSAWNLFLQSENQALRESNEALQARLEEQQTYALRGSGGEGEVIRLEDGRAVLVAHGLEPVPEDRVYEVWVLRDGVPEPAGLFRPEDGVAATTIEASLRGADAVAVTVEPEGGSPMPTGEILFTAEVT